MVGTLLVWWGHCYCGGDTASVVGTLLVWWGHYYCGGDTASVVGHC